MKNIKEYDGSHWGGRIWMIAAAWENLANYGSMDVCPM
jgi:hypothetical protein